MTDDSAPRIFSPLYYERLREIEENHPWAQAMRRLELEILRRHGGPVEALLDAGCGTGLFLDACRRTLGARVAIGCDISVEGLRLAQRRLPALAAADTVALPVAAESVDVVLCNDVLQHLTLPQADKALEEFWRVLRPSGLLLLRVAARRGLGSKKHQDTPSYRQWEPAKLRDTLRRQRFEILFLSLVNCLPSLLADLRVFWRPAPAGDAGLALPASSPAWKSALLTAYWRCEAHLVLDCGWRPPLGHTVVCLARKAR